MADSPDRLALVSSLYAPGTMACWYLTMLSVFLSWILHPRKGRSASIDVDLIAVLTIPSVAAGHVIWQIHPLPTRSQTDKSSDDAYLQLIAAIKAPLATVNSFMIFVLVLFFSERRWWRWGRWKIATVSPVVLLCLCAEHFATRPPIFNNPSTSKLSVDRVSEYFLSYFLTQHILLATIFITCAMILLQYVQLLAPVFNFRFSEVPTQQSRLHQRTVKALNHTLEVCGRLMSRIDNHTFVYLMLAIIATAWTGYSIYGLFTLALALYRMTHSLTYIFGNFFPQAPGSISDLDQAVALVAGAIVLCFRIFSIGKYHYARWKANIATNDIRLHGLGHQ